MRLVKPRRVFSRPESLATPFCTMTFPECKCVTVGTPLSLRKINASRTCRPICCIWGKVNPLPRAAYFWFQSSFQKLRSICKTNWSHQVLNSFNYYASDHYYTCNIIIIEQCVTINFYPINQILEASLIDGLNEDYVVLIVVVDEIEIENRQNVGMLQSQKEIVEDIFGRGANAQRTIPS